MTLTIGKLAQNAGINVETIRYYERKGLIQQPPRKRSGYRQYSLDTLDRIRFIRSAKSLGLSLHEIAELLNLLDNSLLDCDQAETLVDKKLSEIEEKIRLLETMKQALVQLKQACKADQRDDACLVEKLYHTPNQTAGEVAR